MKEKPIPVKQLSHFIARDLRLSEKDEILHTANLGELRQRLNEIIGYLLDHDFNRLLNILYRIDVPEQKLREAFRDDNSDPISATITDLVIERQLLKIETREKYRNR